MHRRARREAAGPRQTGGPDRLDAAGRSHGRPQPVAIPDPHPDVDARDQGVGYLQSYCNKLLWLYLDCATLAIAMSSH